MSRLARVTIFSILILMLISSSSNIFSIRSVNAAPENSVYLDMGTYSWTDRVNITIFAPEYNLSPNQIDTIGNNGHGSIQVCTSGQCIPYQLTETGTNTGIFNGYVTLTGDPSLKGAIGVDGQGTNPSGITSQCSPVCGPKDGKLRAENSDSITVSFVGSDNQKVMTNAQITWYLGDIHFDKPKYSTNDQAVLNVTDYDMIIDPLVIENLPVTVSSSGDPKGITVTLVETSPDTGIFQGTVRFSTNSPSSGNVLYVTGNDKVKAEYIDRTVPPPYSPSDLLRISTTADISGYNNGAPAGNPSGTTTHDYSNYSLQQGEWIKNKPYLQVESNDNLLQQQFLDSLLQPFSALAGQKLKSPNDIDWLSTTVTSISTDKIMVHEELQVLGKHVDFGNFSLEQNPSAAIPTNAKIGDTFDNPFSTSSNPSKFTVTAIKSVQILGKSTDVYEVTANQTTPGNPTTEKNWIDHYDVKTGMLLDSLETMKIYNSTKFLNVQMGNVPIEWSQLPGVLAQSTTPSGTPSLGSAHPSLGSAHPSLGSAHPSLRPLSLPGLSSANATTPEFGPATMLVFVIAVIGIIVFISKAKIRRSMLWYK